MTTNIFEDISARGYLHIKKFRNGVLIEDVKTKNMIVTLGKQHVLNRLMSNSATPVNHMAIGSGGTAPVSSDTTLQNQLSRLGIGLPVLNESALTLTYTGIFPAGNGTGSISEAGLFNASSGGMMFARTTFPPIEKTIDDTIAISWHIALS